MDFFQESLCAQAFLKLIAKGSAIVAELLRLSQLIPKIFLFPDNEEHKAYRKLILEFDYFKDIDAYEEEIMNSPNYEDLEDNLFERYFKLVERFFKLFESIIRYKQSIDSLIREIEDGSFIESLDSLLQADESKQVLAESYYYLGLMMIFLDNQIPGPCRERIVIAYVRFKGGQNAIPNLHEVCRLTKKTGFIPDWYPVIENRTPFVNVPNKQLMELSGEKKNKKLNYSAKMMRRFAVDEEIVKKIVLSIKDGDIYKQTRAFPSPEHRSFALANQSSTIFVLLYFIPDYLKQENSKLREIVDKHFYDNWIIPVFMGYLVDLTEEWRMFDAGKRAINNTVNLGIVQDLSQQYKGTCKTLINKFWGEMLLQGVMNEEYILKNLNGLMNILREANITCRWLMLHRLSKNPEISGEISKAVKIERILALLLYTSQFELKFVKIVKILLDKKEDYWISAKEQAQDNMSDLSEYFSGKTTFKLIKPNPQYSEWFADINSQIESLDPEQTGVSSRKIQQLMKALEDVEKYDQIDNNMQVLQYLQVTRQHLKRMLKVVNLKDRTLSDIAQITDLSYCARCINEYISHMQNTIKKDSKSTLLLRATFMKLSSIMNTPMVRIIQANSEDFQSVSLYYSGELMRFVRHVLQVIPYRVFYVANELVKVLTPKIKSMPGTIDQTELRDYALFETRARIARCASEIAVYTDGVMNMDKYIIGIIEVVPVDILEEGLRKELLDMITEKLETQLRFQKCENLQQFEQIIVDTFENLDSLKKTVEYIQDLLNIYGLKIWYDEYNNMIQYYLDIEWNYMRKKELPDEALALTDGRSLDQIGSDKSKVYLKKLKLSEGSITFLGRLTRQLIKFTSGAICNYMPNHLCFYDFNKQPTVTMKLFLQIRNCIGASGMSGVDQLLGFMVVSEFANFNKEVTRMVQIQKGLLKQDAAIFKDLNCYVADLDKKLMISRKKLQPYLESFTKQIEKMGHLTILREMVLRELNIAGKQNSQKLYMLLENINECFVNEAQFGKFDGCEEEKHNAHKLLLKTIGVLSLRLGIGNPKNKIYMRPKPIEYIPQLLFMVLLQNSYNFGYSRNLAHLYRRAPLAVDPIKLILGAFVLMNQFDEELPQLLFFFIAQYVKSTIQQYQGEINGKNQEVNVLMGNCQVMVECLRELNKHVKMDPDFVNTLLPVNILNVFSQNVKIAL